MAGRKAQENSNGEALDLSFVKQTLLGSQALDRESEDASKSGFQSKGDTGLLDRASLTGDQRRDILVIQQLLPSAFQFPKRLVDLGACQKYHHCSVQLFQEYIFACYSQYLDSVFCGLPFMFNSIKDTVLVSTLLRDWSNSKKILERHSRSKDHIHAVAKTDESVAYEQMKRLTVRSQHALKQVIEIIKLCGKQNV